MVLNIGGTRFETYISTLTKYPDSLLGAMFSERNVHLRKPDKNGEYFFDRSGLAFESILNFYRTGVLLPCPGISKQMLIHEADYWQLPSDQLTCSEDQKIGNLALNVLRKKVDPTLSKIKGYILDIVQKAAMNGMQSFSIEFKESQHYEFYGFLSNFSHRELLLRDLIQQNFDVSFNDLTSGQGHSYILFITLWNRYTRQTIGDSTVALVNFSYFKYF